jgi:hypothetical protein
LEKSSFVCEHFRRGGKCGGHDAGEVPAVNHRVADFRSGDDEADFVTLGTVARENVIAGKDPKNQQHPVRISAARS